MRASGEYLIQLTKREMNTAQTTQVSLYLHTINDFERIGDHASYIAHMANEMHDNHTQFSQAAWDELNIVMEQFERRSMSPVMHL